MACFKCKMCGGSLDVTAGITIIECEYCGTQQTLPKTTDESVQNLFNRASLMRQKCEFDKAEAIYEKIIETDPSEAEAYWGAILSKYGIEYVEDPTTKERIPTCHRASYEAVVSDDYYKKAIEHADENQRILYEKEARRIDNIQKDILAISQKEDPYDVFICYKETDADGRRTQDSVIANDIYHNLTEEGYKVFYAAITLEDMLGSAYEPVIFAALNSAKVMLCIGTKVEYFNAVWVKNEWSRFLKMMKNDHSKVLIPCYKGIDAYDLPEEFSHLQAQDMSKIGFINDLIRGIKKVTNKNAAPAAPSQTVVLQTDATAAVGPLLKRASIFLSDGEIEKAKEYCDRVLDIDPENSDAYLYSLMCELEIKSEDELKNAQTDFSTYHNYERCYRYADDERRAMLDECLILVKSRVEKRDQKSAYNKRIGKLNAEIAEYRKVMAAGVQQKKNIENEISTVINGKAKSAKIGAIMDIIGYWIPFVLFTIWISALKGDSTGFKVFSGILFFLSVGICLIIRIVGLCKLFMNDISKERDQGSAIGMVVLSFITLNIFSAVMDIKAFLTTEASIRRKHQVALDASEKKIKSAGEEIIARENEIEQIKEKIKELDAVSV